MDRAAVRGLMGAMDNPSPRHKPQSGWAVRLMNAGVTRLDARGWGLCYHLWHPPVSRTELPTNDELLADSIEQRATRCASGLDQHLGKDDAHSPA